MKIASRCEAMTSFLAMDVLETAQRLEREGRSIIHLEVGEPDFDTPECICRAAAEALTQGETHYTHSLGIVELREAVAKHYLDRYKVYVDPRRVIITQGTSPAMLMAFSTLLDPGDKVITSDPCYACYHNFIRFPGGEPVSIPVTEEDGFQFRVSAIAKAMDKKVKAIVINSPANPTGTLLSPDRMKAIAQLADQAGIRVISDEIYHGLVYEGQEHSILEFTDRAIVFNGFSKLYAMTGWRLGYAIVPEVFVRPMQKFCQNFFVSANTQAQWAGVAALEQAEADVLQMKAVYDTRRKYMLKRLKGMGFSIPTEPTGAFYIIVNMRSLARRFGGSSLQLAYDILEQVGVGVTPGIDFGAEAEGFIRFSYANSMDNIIEGMDRIESYVREAQG